MTQLSFAERAASLSATLGYWNFGGMAESSLRLGPGCLSSACTHWGRSGGRWDRYGHRSCCSGPARLACSRTLTGPWTPHPCPSNASASCLSVLFHYVTTVAGFNYSKTTSSAKSWSVAELLSLA